LGGQAGKTGCQRNAAYTPAVVFESPVGPLRITAGTGSGLHTTAAAPPLFLLRVPSMSALGFSINGRPTGQRGAYRSDFFPFLPPLVALATRKPHVPLCRSRNQFHPPQSHPPPCDSSPTPLYKQNTVIVVVPKDEWRGGGRRVADVCVARASIEEEECSGSERFPARICGKVLAARIGLMCGGTPVWGRDSCAGCSWCEGAADGLLCPFE